MILSNTGEEMKEITEIQAQLLHYTIVFSPSDTNLEQ